MRSVGIRLTIQITVVVILAVVILGILIVYQQERKFSDLLQARAERVQRQLSIVLGNPLWNYNITQVEQILHSYLSDPDVLSIHVIENEKTTRYFAKDPSTFELVDLTQEPSQQLSYSDAFQEQIEIVYEEDVVGTCQITFSRQFITTQIHETMLMMSIALLSLIGIEALMLSVLVRRNISLPLAPVARAARQIAAGDLLSVRLGTAKFQDEIGVLRTAFHEMISHLQELANAATGISRGDLEHEVHISSKQDMLGQAFQRMSTYLSEMASMATAIAEGDLTVNIPLRSDTDAFGQAMRSMARGLHALIQQIRTSAEQIAATGKMIVSLTKNDISIVQHVQTSVEKMIATMLQMGSSVEDVASNMDMLLSSVEETSATMSQMKISITNIASNTTDLAQHTQQTISDLNQTVRSLEGVTAKTTISKELSQETIHDAIEGQQAVEQFRASMDTIQQTNIKAVEAITRFEKLSREIGTILDVIHDITEQSSLLALNASIIAAQAGSHGKGFSVIAEEMRNLANEVNASTKNIGTIVQTVQKETNTVVHMIHAGTTDIEQGVGRAQYAEQQLQKIIASTQRSSTEVTEIADELQEQMQTIHKTMRAVEQMSSMVSEITRATNEEKSSTIQIHNAVENIRTMTSQTQKTTTEQLDGVQLVIEAANTVSSLTEENLESSKSINHAATADLTSQAQILLQAVDRFTLQLTENPSSESSRHLNQV